MDIKDKLKNLFAEKLADAIQPAFEQAAEELVNALSEVSLRDLVELTEGGDSGSTRKSASAPSRTKSSSKRLPRRSTEEIDAAADKVASLLGKKKNGLRAEEIRGALKMDVRELPRVIKAALAAKKIAVLSGQKRSTTYGIKVGGAAKPAKKKAKPAKNAKSEAKATKSKTKSTANGVAATPPSASS
jgi:hypothetical protein